MAGLTDTTPTKDIVNAFKVFDKDVRSRLSAFERLASHIVCAFLTRSALDSPQNDSSCNRDELASALCSMGDKLTGDQVRQLLTAIATGC